MTFKYKKKSKRAPRMNIDRLPPPSKADEEELTGWWHGKEASDIEERFGRGLDNANLEHEFQVYIPTAFSVPSEDKVVDFLVTTLMIPVEIDGEIGHKTAGQQAKDAVRDAHLNPELAKYGYSEIRHIKWYDLESQELADLAAMELA